MRRDDGRFRDGQDVPERLLGDVRHVHHHPEAVHLGHHLLAERRESVVQGFARAGGIAQLIVPAVRQRDVPCPKVVELLHVGQIRPDRVPVLDAGHDDPLAGPGGRLNRVGARDERAAVRVHLLRQALQCLELSHRPLPRPRVSGIIEGALPDVDSQECAIHAAFLHLGQVAFQRGGRRPGIDGGGGVVRTEDVDVRVERQRTFVDGQGLGHHRVRGRRSLWHGRRQARRRQAHHGADCGDSDEHGNECSVCEESRQRCRDCNTRHVTASETA